MCQCTCAAIWSLSVKKPILQLKPKPPERVAFLLDEPLDFLSQALRTELLRERD